MFIYNSYKSTRWEITNDSWILVIFTKKTAWTEFSKLLPCLTDKLVFIFRLTSAQINWIK